MQSIFGPDGLIAKAHPEYEHRPGQIDMAEAVLRAFEQKRHLIVEAGTGTGKTLAYLVPAIAAACGSGARVVISTGTKNLQEQLMDKDIPVLQEILPAKFRAALMKGELIIKSDALSAAKIRCACELRTSAAKCRTTFGQCQIA